MKYSINSSGYIVAERDIYSLGGFIPKGSVGCKVANGDQISQDGECWVAKGAISTRPDFRVKDNAYLGEFVVGTGTVHTDGIKELSGDTLIPGPVCLRTISTAAYGNCDMFVKDSFIGVTMDVLCGPVSTTTAFPFEQGRYEPTVPKGTLFTSGTMKVDSSSSCRCTATVRIGRGANVYVPTGYTVRVLWAYYDTSNQLAYAGETEVFQPGLNKLNNPVYKVCMLSYHRADITPANLLATGAKILGHVSGSVRSFLNAISASGSYFLENCTAAWKINDFSFSTDRHAMFAGYARNCNMTFYNSADLGVFGRFSNIGQLDLYRLAAPGDYSDPNRDTFVTASDCPLLRVTAAFQTSALKSLGNLVLRRCIVPKAIFTDNIHNGNVYEDIDFSYANEFVETKAGNNFDMWSSHKQGEYAAIGAGVAIAGLISRPENLAAGSVLGPGIDSILLDGSMIERGSYVSLIGSSYEDAKQNNIKRLRTVRPIRCKGASLPVLSGTWRITSVLYLDENMNIASEPLSGTLPIDETKPFIVFNFETTNDSEVYVQDFVELNYFIRSYKYDKVPEITGSSYVGAGVTVRGDVKLIGDPYVNRVFDVNMWERGNVQPLAGGTWQDGFFSSGVQYNRFRTKDIIPVEPGGTISRPNGGKLVAWFFDGDKKRTASSGTGWVTSFVVPENVSYVGMVADVNGDGLVTEGDIAAAGIKYVRAFKKRRYITNELDRTSPEDTLLTPDYWEQGSMSSGASFAGQTYESLKIPYTLAIRLKKPINVCAPGRVIGQGAGFNASPQYLDALTKLYSPAGPDELSKTALLTLTVVKSPAANTVPSEAPNTRVYVEFIPSPRIVVPYGFSSMTVGGAKVRMYDNAVLSKPMDATTQKGEIVLSGDAVARYDFVTVPCFCSNGHSDAIVP